MPKHILLRYAACVLLAFLTVITSVPSRESFPPESATALRALAFEVGDALLTWYAHHMKDHWHRAHVLDLAEQVKETDFVGFRRISTECGLVHGGVSCALKR